MILFSFLLISEQISIPTKTQHFFKDYFNFSKYTPAPTKDWFPPSPPWPPKRTPRETKIFFKNPIHDKITPQPQIEQQKENPTDAVDHIEFASSHEQTKQGITLDLGKGTTHSHTRFFISLILLIIIVLFGWNIIRRNEITSNNGESLLIPDETY